MAAAGNGRALIYTHLSTVSEGRALEALQRLQEQTGLRPAAPASKAR